MFNLRYSLLAMLQVALGGGNFLLLYRAFGSGEASAGYLFSQSVMAAVQLVLMMFQEQFIYDYHRMRATSAARARLYVAAFLVLSHALGLLAGALLFFFAAPLVRLSAPYMPDALQAGVADLLRQLAIVAALWGPSAVLQQVLAARGRIGASYLLTSIPPLFLFLALMLQVRLALGVVQVTQCLALGTVVSYAASLAFTQPVWPRALRTFMRRALRTVAASVRVRSAHNVHNLYVVVGLNHFASTLPVNLVSWLFLAQRGADILSAVAFGPTQRILVNRVARWVREHKTADVLQASRALDRKLPWLFLAGALAALALVPAARWLNPTADAEIQFARICVLLFLAQALLASMELPLALVSLAGNRSDIFFLANCVFVLCSLALYWALRQALPLHSFLVSLVLAQFANFHLIRRRGRSVLLRIQPCPQ